MPACVKCRNKFKNSEFTHILKILKSNKLTSCNKYLELS